MMSLKHSDATLAAFALIELAVVLAELVSVAKLDTACSTLLLLAIVKDNSRVA
jgi:hypothetical protein